MGCVCLHALAQWKATCAAVSHCIFWFLLWVFFCLRAFVSQNSVTALWGVHCGLALKRAHSGRGVRSATPAQEKSSEGFQCALRVFVRACYAAVLQRHCLQGSPWLKPQLILTSCQIRYLSHLLHQRNSEQLWATRAYPEPCAWAVRRFVRSACLWSVFQCSSVFLGRS